MRSSRSTGARVAGWCGIAIHGAMFFPYAWSGHLVPRWGVAVLLVIWAGLLVGAVMLLRSRPMATPLVPLAALAVWILAISAGEAWLGWTD